ncbi:hypothetical protein M0D69_00750 [Caballeronia sp. SEWSISQ10-4 2]|uniref:hypothetical protein n=1 Tax=Caballeronia sp. SEWSISQ10-4 2 TaxID=2937438 RepID=UPI002652CC1A|nr:hypothetical protein [Caballeronia sp. SEWSISQ10-4 2]MDN7176573.1 hypothetical protein [Caballeronia sp. SEWSISQ10-4 2]
MNIHESACTSNERSSIYGYLNMSRTNSAAAIVLLSALLLSACTDIPPYRTQLLEASAVDCPTAKLARREKCGHVTPEIVKGSDAYEMHVVEFDDQGWLYPDRPASATQPAETPSGQIEHVMKRLRQLLDDGDDLSIIVFVHGWKHDADVDDSNVDIFRHLLQTFAGDELYQASHGGKRRKVVGIYVAWRGASWPGKDSGPVMDLSFWGRKEAARRVSVGSARELFARMRAMQRYYNATPAGENKALGPQNEQSVNRPRIRTLMIGHSFGALILFAATSGPLTEVLSAQDDLPGTDGGYDPAERIADMIVLVNPAFEAVRYEPLFAVADRYKPRTYQPPLLVSITSTADWATGMAFPAGRAVYTVFERPASSDAQSVAMNHTPGHIDHYLTHRLHGPRSAADGASSIETPASTDDATCHGWKSTLRAAEQTGASDSQNIASITVRNKSLEVVQSEKFLTEWRKPSGLLASGWTRNFCGGDHLEVVNHPEMPGTDNSNALVWNIETDGEVMKDHDDIMNPNFIDFLRQLYGDVALPQVGR